MGLPDAGPEARVGLAAPSAGHGSEVGTREGSDRG